MQPAFKITSPETGTEYWIYVQAPAGAGPWPALLILDGDALFAPGVAAYRTLPADAGVPAMLLVGIGYGASYGKPANKRGRDYTPVHHSDEPSSGGADIFLKFVAATLWPELARRYPVDPASRGFAGHSLGSLLVLHALFQARPYFTHYLASAPSIWWAERALLQHVAVFRDRQAVLPARLFLSVGEEDSVSMTTDLAALEALLAARPFAQLEVTTRRFPKRNHFNVLPDAFAAGLTALYGDAAG